MKRFLSLCLACSLLLNLFVGFGPAALAAEDEGVYIAVSYEGVLVAAGKVSFREMDEQYGEVTIANAANVLAGEYINNSYITSWPGYPGPMSEVYLNGSTEATAWGFCGSGVGVSDGDVVDIILWDMSNWAASYTFSPLTTDGGSRRVTTVSAGDLLPVFLDGGRADNYTIYDKNFEPVTWNTSVTPSVYCVAIDRPGEGFASAVCWLNVAASESNVEMVDIFIPTALDSNGTPNSYETISVEKGSTIDALLQTFTIPLRNGYTGTWSWTSGTAVTRDTRVDIRWTAIDYNVTFDFGEYGEAAPGKHYIETYDVQGHTYVDGSKTYDGGSQYHYAFVPQPQIETGYAFTGWTVTYYSDPTFQAEEPANGRPTTLSNTNSHTLGNSPSTYGHLRLTANYTDKSFVVALPKGDGQYTDYAKYYGNEHDGYSIAPLGATRYASKLLSEADLTTLGKTYNDDYIYYSIPAGNAFQFTVYLSVGYSDMYKKFGPNGSEYGSKPEHPLWEAYYTVDANGELLDEGYGAYGANFSLANFSSDLTNEEARNKNIARMEAQSASSPDGIIYVGIEGVTPNVLGLIDFTRPSDLAPELSVTYLTPNVVNGQMDWGSTIQFTVDVPEDKIAKVETVYDRYVDGNGNLAQGAYFYYHYGEQRYGYAREDVTLYPDASGVYTWTNITPVINSRGSAFIRVSYYEDFSAVKDEAINQIKDGSLLHTSMSFACYAVDGFRQEAETVCSAALSDIHAVALSSTYPTASHVIAAIRSITDTALVELKAIRVAGVAAYEQQQDEAHAAKLRAEKLETGYQLVSVTLSDIAGKISQADTEVVIHATGIEEGGENVKISADIAKDVLSAVVAAGLDLSLTTPVGTVTLSHEALSAILGNDNLNGYENTYLSLVLGEVDGLTSEQQATIAANQSCFIYDLTVTNGRGHKVSFGNQIVTVTVPYVLQPGENPDKICVWYIDNQGKMDKMTDGHYADGYVTFTTTHFSVFMIGSSEVTTTVVRSSGGSTIRSLARKTALTVTSLEKNALFTDVLPNHWAYNYIKYMSENGFMDGTDGAFAPTGTMTCGELVAILAEMSGDSHGDALIWAEGIGLIGTDYDGSALLSRKDLAAAITVYIHHMGGSLAPNAVDISDIGALETDAALAVTNAVAAGWMDLTSNGLFCPNGVAARDVVAKALALMDQA